MENIFISTENSKKTITIIKGIERYVFRYQEGEEKEIISALTEMVLEKKTKFDWYDAVTVSHTIGQDLCKKL